MAIASSDAQSPLLPGSANHSQSGTTRNEETSQMNEFLKEDGEMASGVQNGEVCRGDNAGGESLHGILCVNVGKCGKTLVSRHVPSL